MIDDKMAKMAVNTLKAYCDGKKCSDCAVSKTCDLANVTFRHFANYPIVGVFENFLQKPKKKTPKFDATLPDSPNFRDYINGILELEADRAGISPSGLDKVKCYPNGTIKVWYKSEMDGGTVYKGKAKCHPNDAFNPEIGIKLAVQRIVEKVNKPFVPEENEAYYYADDENRIYSTINHNTNTDILNIAVGNCFRKRKEAHANKESIRKRIERATELLKTLRDEGDE
jgi:hypothetical protein